MVTVITASAPNKAEEEREANTSPSQPEMSLGNFDPSEKGPFAKRQPILQRNWGCNGDYVNTSLHLLSYFIRENERTALPRNLNEGHQESY